MLRSFHEESGSSESASRGGVMWIELGLFLVVIAFAIHQIRDVRKEQRKRAAEKESEQKH